MQVHLALHRSASALIMHSLPRGCTMQINIIDATNGIVIVSMLWVDRLKHAMLEGSSKAGCCANQVRVPLHAELASSATPTARRTATSLQL